MQMQFFPNHFAQHLTQGGVDQGLVAPAAGLAAVPGQHIRVQGYVDFFAFSALRGKPRAPPPRLPG